MRIMIVALLLGALAGCGGEAVIDASSDDAFEESLERVTAGMGDDELEEFAGAVALIGMSVVDFTHVEADHGQRIMDRLHGMTASEVLAEADSLR